jgi:hypothetical protein
VERPFTATVRANIFGNFIPSMTIFKRKKCRSEFADGSPGQFVCRHYWFCVISWSDCDIFRHTDLQGPASYCYDFLSSRKSLKALECCKINVTFSRFVFRVIPHTHTHTHTHTHLNIWTRRFSSL